MSSTTPAPSPSAPQPRKRRRVLLIALGSVLLVLVVLLALLPTIASGLAPGIIRSQAGKFLEGDVSTQRVSLSWGGPQRVGPVTWRDPAGNVVAQGTVEAGKGLLGLATGGLALGEVTLRDATVALERDEQGRLNVQRLLRVQNQAAPAQPAPAQPQAQAQPPRVPAGLRVRVRLENVDVTFTDRARAGGPQTVSLSDVAGSAVLDPASPLLLELTGQASAGAAGAASAAGDGSLRVQVSATDWARPDGVLTPGTADVTAQVDLTRFPTALVDALAPGLLKDEQGRPASLSEALGPALDAKLTAQGTMQNAQAGLRARARGLDAEGMFRVSAGVLSVDQPLTILASGPTLGNLAPQLRAATQASPRASITQLPDVRAVLSQLSLRLPQGGAPLDLRGAALDVSVQTTQVQGAVVTQEGRAPVPMTIAPATLEVRTQDLAQGVRAELRTSATLDGQPAGTIALDLEASGLLDPAGAIRPGMPAGLRAEARVDQMATAVAQPFVEALGLNLPRDLGPTLTLAANAMPGSTPDALEVNVGVEAELLRAEGYVTLSPSRITTRGAGVVMQARAGGRILEALTREGPWRVTPAQNSAGVLTLFVNDLDVPRDARGAPVLHQARLRGQVQVEKVTLTPAPREGVANPQPSAPLTVDGLSATLVLQAGGDATTNGQLIALMGSERFVTGWNFSVPGLLIEPATDPATGARPALALADPFALRPRGDLEVAGLPVSVLGLTMPPGPETDRLLNLVREVAGPAMTLRAQSAPAQNNAGDLALRIVAESGRLSAQVDADLSERSVALTRAELVSNIEPRAFDALLAFAAPDMQDAPRLAGPGRLEASIRPITIPLSPQRTPLLAQAGTLAGVVRVPDALAMDNVRVGSSPARVGVRGLEIEFEAPMSSLLAGEGAAPADADVRLRTQLDVNAAQLATLTGSSRATLSQGKPQGALRGEATLADVRTALLDQLLGKPGIASGALGETAQVRVQASRDTDQTTRAQLALEAPNVRTTGPLDVRMTKDRLELTQPAAFTIRAEPAFVNALLTPAPSEGSSEVRRPVLRLTEPTTIQLTLDRLLMPLAQKDGAALASVAPSLQAGLSMPAVVFAGRDDAPLRVESTAITMRTAEAQGGAAPYMLLNLAMRGVSGAPGEPAGDLSLDARLRNYLGQDGGFDLSGAVADARGQMPAAPTPLFDALAQKDGLLQDLLGPVVRADLTVENFPLGAGARERGRIDATFESQTARASIRGNVDDRVLVTSEPLRATVTQVSAALAGRFVKGLPLLGTFEKTSENAPAVLEATDVTIPLSNDLSRLSGVFRLDPGEARLGAGAEFSEILNIVGWRTGGLIGQRLEPITVTVRNGVATYPLWTLPIGEFRMQSEGTINLASQQIDVVTWVPLGAIADQAAGKLNTGLGGFLGGQVPVLEAASMIPFRTRGALSDPGTDVDFELLAQTTLRNLRPDRLIERGIEGIGDIFRRRNNEGGGSQPPR